MAQSSSITPSSVLAQTEDGHFLIEPYQGLLNAAPEGWQIRVRSGPPYEPYDGMPQSALHISKKRKRDPSTNEQLNQAHHEEISGWLGDAINKVRESWLSSSPSTWSPAYAGLEYDEAAAPDELDLATLEKSCRELQALAHADEVREEDSMILQGTEDISFFCAHNFDTRHIQMHQQKSR